MIAKTAEFKTTKEQKIQIEGLPAIHSLEAERAVLGSMLTDPDAVVDEAIEKLNPDDFFHLAHRQLFECLVEMRNEHRTIETSTVFQYLEDRQLAESMGGIPFLAELSSGVLSVLTASSHIQTVREKGILRCLREACAKIVLDTRDRQHEVETVLDEAESSIFKLNESHVTKSARSAGEVVKKAIEIIQLTTKLKGQYNGVPSGFHELDRLTTGFKGGEMIVIAARPGVGKTAFALSMVKNMLKEKYSVEEERMKQPGYSAAFFSLEMTGEQLMLRLLASCADVSLQKMREGTLTGRDIDGLSIVAEEITSYPLHIDESSFLSISQLRAKARRMMALHKIEILVVDYLQLLTSSSRKAQDNRQVEVAEISRGIKALAMELNIPIVVLAQLNRKPEETNQDPALHHLRESGSIEQDADIVLMLSRKFEKDGQAETTETRHGPAFTAKVNIAKQRNGPTGTVELVFNARSTRFDSAPRQAN